MLNVARRNTADLQIESAKTRLHTSGAHIVEVNSNEFAEARRVVVSDGFCVAERLEHRIRLHNLIFERHFFAAAVALRNAERLSLRSADRRKVGNNLKMRRRRCSSNLQPPQLIFACVQPTFFVFSVLPAPDSPVMSID